MFLHQNVLFFYIKMFCFLHQNFCSFTPKFLHLQLNICFFHPSRFCFFSPNFLFLLSIFFCFLDHFLLSCTIFYSTFFAFYTKIFTSITKLERLRVELIRLGNLIRTRIGTLLTFQPKKYKKGLSQKYRKKTRKFHNLIQRVI